MDDNIILEDVNLKKRRFNKHEKFKKNQLNDSPGPKFVINMSWSKINSSSGDADAAPKQSFSGHISLLTQRKKWILLTMA